jgi:hypothetical protein
MFLGLLLDIMEPLSCTIKFDMTRSGGVCILSGRLNSGIKIDEQNMRYHFSYGDLFEVAEEMRPQGITFMCRSGCSRVVINSELCKRFSADDHLRPRNIMMQVNSLKVWIYIGQ